MLFLGLFSTYLALPSGAPLDMRRLTTGVFFLGITLITKQPGMIGVLWSRSINFIIF